MPSWVMEAMGYFGMALVLASFLMKNICWLRIVNLCGAVFCCAYGAITQTWATMALNASLVVINVAYLAYYRWGKKHE